MTLSMMTTVYMTIVTKITNRKTTDDDDDNHENDNNASWGGAVVRALASLQCVPGSIPIIYGLSLLLVLVLAPRVFLRILRFSSVLKNQHF